MVGHEQDWLPAGGHLHHTRDQAERQQLVARRLEGRTFEPVAHAIGVVAHGKRRAQKRLTRFDVQAREVRPRDRVQDAVGVPRLEPIGEASPRDKWT